MTNLQFNIKWLTEKKGILHCLIQYKNHAQPVCLIMRTHN